MDNKTLTIVMLIMGLVLGYFIGTNRFVGNFSSVPGDMHMMSGGNMMRNMDMNGMGNMDAMMGSMMSGLEGKTGDEFDRAFVSGMIVHHQGAVEMAKAALKNAKRQEIKNLANEIISAQTKEIEMMNGWQKDWYGN